MQGQQENDQIRASLKAQHEEIRQIRKVLESLSPRIKLEGDNDLLSTRQVLKELGLKHDDKAWREIRLILIERFGMTKIGNSGYRIPRRRLNDFVAGYFR